jgi:hypothetical protein
MRRDDIPLRALGDTWATNEERHADVLVKTAGLAGGQAVLSDVEAVVGGVDDVRVLELVALL